MTRITIAAIGAALALLTAAPARAQDTITVKTGPDPTEEVPFTITAEWKSSSNQNVALVTIKPAGGQTCAANYRADDASSEDVLTESGGATGSISRNRQIADPGEFIICGYLQESSSSTSARATTGPVPLSVRSAKATVALSAPARANPRQVVQLTTQATTELSRFVLITRKPAGGRGCEPNYRADDAVSDDVADFSVQGAQSVERNLSAGEVEGTYLLCAYVQEGSSDISPEATASLQYRVGPDPCVVARAALGRVERDVRRAGSAAGRHAADARRHRRLARRSSGAVRAGHLRLGRQASARRRIAEAARARAQARLPAAQAAAVTACGPAGAATGGPRSLLGKWSGVGRQTSPRTAYGVSIDLRALRGAAGDIAYPELACGGRLTFLRRKGARYVFRERITTGNCVDEGTVTLELLTPDTVDFRWTKPGDDSRVKADLGRTG